MHTHSDTGAGPSPSDRGGGSDTALPSNGAAQRRQGRWFHLARPKLGIRAFKPVTYSLMHLVVAISVAYALTRDWRIALGVGVIEPMVQTVAYMLHEKAWSLGGKRRPSPTSHAQASENIGIENTLSPTPQT